MTRRQWIAHFRRLWALLQHTSWDLGDSYIAATERWGAAATIRMIASMSGVSLKTAQTYASVARKFPRHLRYLKVDFSLYQEARRLPLELAIPLLEQAEKERWTTNKVRIEAKRLRWAEPITNADIFDDLAVPIARGTKYPVIYADPPWDWEEGGGKSGTATPYYPVLSLERLIELPVPRLITDDAYLFLWSPAATLVKQALPLLVAWGFEFKTHAVWDKLNGGFGVGYYFRMEHEDLLLGVRPNSPSFADSSWSSMIRQSVRGPRGRRHGEKPDIYDRIEGACPGPYLELFARKRREKWDQFGNQLRPTVEDDPSK